MPPTFPEGRLRVAGVSSARIAALRTRYDASTPAEQQTLRGVLASATDETIRAVYDPDGTGADAGDGGNDPATITPEAVAAALPARLSEASIAEQVAAAVTPARVAAALPARLSDAALRASLGRPHPLGILRAGLAVRTITPCRLVFAGSSTTAGTTGTTSAEHRYVNRLIAAIQAAYPSGLGSEAGVVASQSATWGALSGNAGVHGYNAGQGGTTADTYLDNAEAARIAALNPRAVFHMVGSNDYSGGVDPATYRARIEARVGQILAATTGPSVHVLVHAFQRMDIANPAFPWSAYRDALNAIADANPDRVILVDASDEYRAAGVPGTDPFDLVGTDLVHLTDAGHLFMADLLRSALSIAPAGVVGPAPVPPVVADPLTVFTSDTMTGTASTYVGRVTDAAAGGTVQTVQASSTTASAGVAGGVLVPGSSTTAQFLAVPMPHADQALSAKITALPTAGTLTFTLRRNTLASAPNYRAQLAADGALTLQHFNGATALALGVSTIVAPGDVIEVRAVGSTISLGKNGAVVGSATEATVTTPGFAGVALATSTAGWQIDNLVWRAAA